jgi:hypothetical protein
VELSFQSLLASHRPFGKQPTSGLSTRIFSTGSVRAGRCRGLRTGNPEVMLRSARKVGFSVTSSVGGIRGPGKLTGIPVLGKFLYGERAALKFF